MGHPTVRMAAAFVVGSDLLLYAYGGTFAANFAPDFAYSIVGGLLCMWFTYLGWRDMRRGLNVMREARHECHGRT